MLKPKPKTIPKLKDALQHIWPTLVQKSIYKFVKDFCKLLQACVLAKCGHFGHKM